MKSLKFDLVKTYYDKKKWTIAMVRAVVSKGTITKEEFKEITGKEY